MNGESLQNNTREDIQRSPEQEKYRQEVIAQIKNSPEYQKERALIEERKNNEQSEIQEETSRGMFELLSDLYNDLQDGLMDSKIANVFDNDIKKEEGLRDYDEVQKEKNEFNVTNKVAELRSYLLNKWDFLEH